MRKYSFLTLFLLFCLCLSATETEKKDFEKAVRDAVSRQMQTYPKSTLKDLYKNFFQDKLGRVEQFDLENHGELFDTLNMLVECNWNLREASEQLYIHYNTMKNRYHKIQEVMGVSLDNMEERLEVEFAIKSKIVNDI